MTVKSSTKSKTSDVGFKALEEARDAVIKLKTLQPLLSPEDEETISILMDKQLTDQLTQSLKEAEKGKLEPLSSILK